MKIENVLQRFSFICFLLKPPCWNEWVSAIVFFSLKVSPWFTLSFVVVPTLLKKTEKITPEDCIIDSFLHFIFRTILNDTHREKLNSE